MILLFFLDVSVYVYIYIYILVFKKQMVFATSVWTSQIYLE